MKIAFANSSKIWGGAEVMTAAFLRGLRSRGHDVELLCRPGSPFLARIGSEVACHPTLGGFDANPVAVLRSLRVLARFRPDVLVTMTQKDPRIAGVAARILGVPVLLRQPMDLGFRRTRHHRLFYGAIPTHYVANSQATRRSMIASVDWLDPADVTVIYNGIDVERFAGAKPADLLLPERGVKIGFVGRFEDRKGIRELMHAWPTIAASVADAHLVLAGEGGVLDDEVRAWAARAERVQRIGFREDMSAVMAALDILVMPSHFEGFGIVLVEAMSAGVLVVASRASNLPELMDDGVEGLLVPVGDAAALASAVTELARDPAWRATMGRAGLRRARQDFRVERMLDEYEALLFSIATEIPTSNPPLRRPTVSH
jgi:glycosyltransferase involved in cell wall biosynthesis